MAEELHIEILVITLLLVISFVSGHLLRKFKIIWLPESLLAVVLSMIMAFIWYKMPGLSSGLSFNNETFFLVLLPFIIFESGFSVHRQSLFRNMGSILMFAIIGTFLAAFGIGGFLYATVKARGARYDYSFLDCMIIGAIMSSTDPVATLSIFSKLDMDRMTYSLVFGESMLNDAVSIVSFKTLIRFYTHAFSAASFFGAVGMFCLIFVGAFLIGIVMAALTSFILRRTDIGRAHRPMELVFIVGGAYLAYFMSDFLSLSGIVSIFFYGIASRHYTYYTLSEESQHGIHWIFEAVKDTCEMLVFVLLGVTILQDSLRYDWYLIAMTSIGCVLARFVATVLQSVILNFKRPDSDKISWRSQVIIWNAGLRGAVAYALAVSGQMPESTKTNYIITTVHAAVIFTIVFHGLLTFPLVWLTGLGGTNAHTRELSEPRPARKKLHSFWSRLDKSYIIPFISYPRPSPEQRANTENAIDAADLELDERDSSIDFPASGRFSYDGMEDSNPQNLDTSLFERAHQGSRPSSVPPGRPRSPGTETELEERQRSANVGEEEFDSDPEAGFPSRQRRPNTLSASTNLVKLDMDAFEAGSNATSGSSPASPLVDLDDM